jgi:phage-related protein
MNISQLQTFLDALDSPHRDEAAAMLRLVRARGNALREPHSKSLGGGLLELRGKHGVRLFYTFRPGRRIVALDGFVKRRQDIPASVLDRVRAYLAAIVTTRTKKGEGV